MLKISQVTKSYGNLKANDNINIEIPEKSVALLVGPNGAGKSTLLKCIMGLLRYSGEIEINGLRNKSVEAKRIMGYVRKFHICILCSQLMNIWNLLPERIN